MPIKTITQLRADTPTVTLTDADLFALDQTSKTVAATLAQLKAFVRPAVASTTVNGLMSSTDKTKLNQIPANATANQTDTYLLDRTNHSGTQSIGTIVNLQTELDKKLESVNVAGVTGLQTALDSKANAADVPDVSGLTTRVTNAETAITGINADKLDKNNPAPTGGFTYPQYTFAGKPSASANANRYIEINDSADGLVLCRSNGTSWIKVAVVGTTAVTAAP